MYLAFCRYVMKMELCIGIWSLRISYFQTKRKHLPWRQLILVFLYSSSLVWLGRYLAIKFHTSYFTIRFYTRYLAIWLYTTHRSTHIVAFFILYFSTSIEVFSTVNFFQVRNFSCTWVGTGILVQVIVSVKLLVAHITWPQRSWDETMDQKLMCGVLESFFTFCCVESHLFGQVTFC